MNTGQIKDCKLRANDYVTGRLNRKLIVALSLLAMFIALPFSHQAEAQFAPHKLNDSNQLPGAVAFQQLLRRPQMNGYVQPYRFITPGQCEVSVWKNGGFEKVDSGQPIALMIGRVYRLKLTNIDRHPGTIIYPSIELINRLYPPLGEADKHAVEILFDQSDLDQVVKGNVVTRVVYLENPELALPVTQKQGEQNWYDMAPGEDPLETSSQYGRPMVIVRVGSRVPDPSDGMAFHFGEPLVTHVEQSGCSSCCGCELCTTADPRLGADEFVCDGGDRDLKVVLQKDDTVAGLDSQDTVGHFSTSEGELLTTESNRVCIYSPRFAAVRKVWQAISSHGSQRMAHVADLTEPKQFNETDIPSTTHQNIRVQQNRATKAAAEFRDQTRGLTVDNTIQLKSFTDGFMAHENTQLMRIGKMQMTEGAKLFRAQQAAHVWGDALAVQAVSKSIQLVITRDVQIVEVGTHVERPQNRPHLRLIKTASTRSARPGETVDFTIRFDNVGDQTIGDITIMDNLTTRLKYVDGTAECSIPAIFEMEPNSSSSHTLKWIISDPLKVNDGGIIRFRCEVR
jgi:uncharacterized repeat protein (TIGR01451 family)